MTPVLSSDVISLGSVLALGPLDGGSHDRRNGSTMKAQSGLDGERSRLIPPSSFGRCSCSRLIGGERLLSQMKFRIILKLGHSAREHLYY